LTFDDGPNDTFTPLLLDFCRQQRFTATFFLVAERAKRLPKITRALAGAGHAVGNHSFDHRYGHFFQRSAKIKEWIESAQTELTTLTGQAPIAFRSPAGVRTPELKIAIQECGLPLVHWNHRFFDTVLPWTEQKAERAAIRASAGDIFLLHDIPRRDPNAFFLALALLVRRLRERNLEPEALRAEDVQT
jgi:peptidoglycan/xylan/chitin deacetylase (PgdA/CDA1 family)